MKWRLEVEIEVTEDWVADGYEATPERIHRILEENDMTWCTPYEYRIRVKTLSAPKKDAIRKLQGYTS